MHVLSSLNRLFRHVLVAVAVLVCLRLSIIMLCKGVSKVTCIRWLFVHCFLQLELHSFFVVMVFVEGELLDYPEKTLGARKKTNHDTAVNSRACERGPIFAWPCVSFPCKFPNGKILTIHQSYAEYAKNRTSLWNLGIEPGLQRWPGFDSSFWTIHCIWFKES